MCRSNTKCTVLNQSLTGDHMSLDERKLMFIHFLYQRSGTEEEYSELVQLLEDVTTYQSDPATKKISIPKRKDELDREKGLQMRNAAMVTHASKSFHFG